MSGIDSNVRLGTKLVQGGKEGTSAMLMLEPRFMFDAAGVATAADAGDGGDSEALHAENQAVDQALLDALNEISATAPAGDRREIVFIDPTVSDHETLMEGIRADAEVVLIDPMRDGLAQIAEVLSERSGINAVHVISHGAVGEIQLGSVTLNSQTLAGYDAELAAISAALSDEADILLYGCYVGQDDAGRSFIDALATATSADVAASNDLTASSERGGDWVLEVHSGSIESDIVISEAAGLAFTGTLAPADENYEDNATHGASQASPFTLDGLVYTSDAGGVGVVVGSDFGAAQGTGNVMFLNYAFAAGATTFSFGSSDTNDKFKLNSFVMDAFGSGSSFSEQYTITGYSGGGGGTVVASDTVNFTVSDNSGSISYAKSSDAGGTLTFSSAWDGIDTIVFVRTDGAAAGAAIDNLDFSPANAAPVLDANGAGGGTANTTTFTEDGGAIRIVTSDATLTDDGNLAGLTLVLGATPNGASESIAYDAALNGAATLASLGLTGSYDSGTRTYTLSGNASSAVYQGVLRAMVYNNTSQTPDTTARTVTITATDAGSATAQATSTIGVDSVADVSSVAIANGSYAVGETITVTITFDQAVTVAGGTPTLALDVGGQTRNATLGGTTTSTTTLTFSYTVQPGDLSDADGVTATASGITLNGATIRDAAGTPDDATLTYAQVNNASATVDTVAPSAPGTPDLAAGSDTGSSNTDNITSDTTPTFT
ncbi:MAG TPA: DUF4347 domain-containing protein, partial [Kaistia sp.]|nr:DUF4347 domain-containing protein [Kaistia sp.]